MKQGLTIQQMAQELLRQSQAKEDYLVNTANLQMESDAGTPALRLLDDNGVDQIEPLEILTIAHRQLGDYLSIPRKYYDRMLKENPELLALNVNCQRQLENVIFRRNEM